jgi:hypothetical protein
VGLGSGEDGKRREVAQTKYTHVSKCKKNKILKSEKNKINLSYIKK